MLLVVIYASGNIKLNLNFNQNTYIIYTKKLIIILMHFKNATLYVGNCNKEQKLS